MKKFKGLLAAALAVTLCLGFLPSKQVKIQAAENLITNGNFDDPDNMEIWNGNGHNGGATVTCEVSDTPIGPDKIMTYGKITNRDSNYNSFAYDITGLIEQGLIEAGGIPSGLCWMQKTIRMLRHPSVPWKFLRTKEKRAAVIYTAAL